MISPGVIAPGRNGTSLSAEAFRSSLVMPGLTMKREPACAAASYCAEDGAGADDGFLDLVRHAPDRFESVRGPQRDLDGLQAAPRKRTGERHCLLRIGDPQHRNHRLAGEQGNQFFGLVRHGNLSTMQNFNRFNMGRIASP
jgi:hypothetical protein